MCSPCERELYTPSEHQPPSKSHNQQRNHVVVRLLAEGSVMVLIMALGWWGMWNVGSYTLSSQSDSLTAEREPIYVGGCPVPDPVHKSTLRESGDRRHGR
jgi:hypothetical protein